ncbi:hypothetical protein MSG28_008142 [Choristoneura fumiferana]|nr:hypothetical protein MSG28_008142 [Choristoneura fumiferana]
MRETFVSILLLVSAARCLDLGKDVNYYKDFYRTPLQLYPGLLPVLEQEYKKRTGNVFKNHMLNKESWAEGMANKRSSKTALSLMLQGKQPYHV